MCLGRVPLWVCARGPGTLLGTEHLSLSYWGLGQAEHFCVRSFFWLRILGGFRGSAALHALPRAFA